MNMVPEGTRVTLNTTTGPTGTVVGHGFHDGHPVYLVDLDQGFDRRGLHTSVIVVHPDSMFEVGTVDRECEWCGENANGEQGSVTQHVISPPVDGYRVETGWFHRGCATSAARSFVE